MGAFHFIAEYLTFALAETEILDTPPKQRLTVWVNLTNFQVYLK